MTLKNNRAPLLYYIKLCAAIESHWYIQTGVTVRKHSIRVKIGNFLSRVTLKIDGWPWKTIGHLSCAASSFVHHFIAIGEFKLELQSGNAPSGSKSTIVLAVWPLNFMDDLEKQQGTSSKQHQALCFISSPFVNSNWSYGLETAKWGHDLCDLIFDLDLLHGQNIRARFQKRSDHCEKVIRSETPHQLTISRSDQIPWTILLRSDHDPGDPARFVDRCWIRNFITTIGHFISNITIVKIFKLPGNIYWNMVCLVSTVCIFSMTLITYTYLSNTACPNRVVLVETLCACTEMAKPLSYWHS